MVTSDSQEQFLSLSACRAAEGQGMFVFIGLDIVDAARSGCRWVTVGSPPTQNSVPASLSDQCWIAVTGKQVRAFCDSGLI